MIDPYVHEYVSLKKRALEHWAINAAEIHAFILEMVIRDLLSKWVSEYEPFFFYRETPGAVPHRQFIGIGIKDYGVLLRSNPITIDIS